MKKFNRARESTDRLIKQKQDTLKTVIDTIEKNSKFKKNTGYRITFCTGLSQYLQNCHVFTWLSVII